MASDQRLSPRFTNPTQVWATDEASPSGLAIIDDTAYLAALRGQRLWRIELATAAPPSAALQGTLGRLRDVVVAPNGRLWLLSNNGDGRGQAREGDDRLVELPPPSPG